MSRYLPLLLIILVAMIIPALGSSLSMVGPALNSPPVWVGGKLNIDGVPALSSEDYKTLMSNPGLTLGVTITNPKAFQSKTVYIGQRIPKDIETRKVTNTRTATFSLSGPVITSTGGNAAAYVLMGRKWNTTAPGFKKVVMSLKDDAYLAGTGMSKTGALEAIAGAESTWNNATNQRPFSGTSALTATQNWKYDGVNNIAFTPYAPTCAAIAATGVWYKTQGVPVGTMYPILESDMTFNSNLKWTATGEAGKVDFQSVVLHELGHTIGLGDIYGKPINDGLQIMGYYSGRRTLGNGDATGVWKLYG